MRREVRRMLELRRERILLDHMIWYTRPWYQRAWLALTMRSPAAL